MAVFGKYTATEPRYYPTLDLQATTGVIVDFTVINGGSYPVDGRWTSDAGPANYVPPSPSGSTPLADHGLLANRPAASALPNQRYIATDTVQEFWSDGSSWYGPFGGSALVATTQSGTTYTLALVDALTVVEFTNASAVTATVPPNSSVAFPLETVINVYAAGAGGVTLAQGAGVTIRNNTAALVQYGECSLRKRATDEWIRLG